MSLLVAVHTVVTWSHLRFDRDGAYRRKRHGEVPMARTAVWSSSHFEQIGPGLKNKNG